MSAILKAFVFDGATHDVRIWCDAECKPWFCASDVGTVLGLGNVRTSIAALDNGKPTPPTAYIM